MNFENDFEKVISRDEVVGALRELATRSVRNPADLNRTDLEVQRAEALVKRWASQEEQRTEGDPIAARRFRIERTTLYRDAGFTDPEYLEEVEGWLLQDTEEVLRQEPASERSPVSYEAARSAIHSLRVLGIPFRESRRVDNPTVLSALELVGAWRAAHGIPEAAPDGQRVHGIDTMEKAHDLVQSVMLWVDAGYEDVEAVQEASETLINVYNDAHDDLANPEVLAVLDRVISSLEERLEKKEKKDRVGVEIEKRVEEARQLVREGKKIDAVGRLTAILVGNPKFNRYLLQHENEKREITELRNAIRDNKDLNPYGL